MPGFWGAVGRNAKEVGKFSLETAIRMAVEPVIENQKRMEAKIDEIGKRLAHMQGPVDDLHKGE